MSFFIFFGYSAYFLARFFPLLIPPGHTPTPHRTPPQTRKTMNPCKYIHPRTKAAENVPQYKPDTMAQLTEQPTPTNDTSPGHVRSGRLFLIIFYVYRANVHTKKAPAYNRGYNINYSYLTIQPSQPAEKVIYK